VVTLAEEVNQGTGQGTACCCGVWEWASRAGPGPSKNTNILPQGSSSSSSSSSGRHGNLCTPVSEEELHRALHRVGLMGLVGRVGLMAEHSSRGTRGGGLASGLWDVMDWHSRLSAGELQRVAVARLLLQ